MFIQNKTKKITSPVTKGQVEGSLTSNFKIIRQGHVNYFSIFEFYDLKLVENDTNFITSSHLHQKLSRLTNIGKNSVFWPPSCTYDVMTYVTWQRQDDVTYVKMCLPSLVTDTLRRFLRLESSKKLQGKNARGVVSTPPPIPPLGVRGLIFMRSGMISKNPGLRRPWRNRSLYLVESFQRICH